MREMERVRRALAGAASRNEAAVLATVLSVEGSVYRGAGARMVVLADGGTIGGVSGGCLEADVVARAHAVLARGAAEIVQYDTRSSDDAVLGLGLGCQGMIDVLLEPLAGGALTEAVAFYGRVAARREPTTILTRTHAQPGSSGGVGARAVLDEAGLVLEGDPALVNRDDDVAREEVRPAVPLLICGAGADAQPLARMASEVGFHVTVVDHRAAFVSRARFPDADALVRLDVTDDLSSLHAHVQVDRRTAAVVMAHSARHDRAYLQAMLAARARYIGVLGPRRRTLELLDARAMHWEFPDSVYSPAGLDLGAETPEEIALSIIAEVSAVFAGRDGGMLRGRPGPIHPDRARAGRPAEEAFR